MYTSNEPIDVVLHEVPEVGFYYVGGPFRSVPFKLRDDALKSIIKRFPKAIIKDKDGTVVATVKAAKWVEPKSEKSSSKLGEAVSLPSVDKTVESENGKWPDDGAAMLHGQGERAKHNPHVYVKGKDAYCIICDNKQENPIHISGLPMAANKSGKTRGKKTEKPAEPETQKPEPSPIPASVPSDDKPLW